MSATPGTNPIYSNYVQWVSLVSGDSGSGTGGGNTSGAITVVSARTAQGGYFAPTASTNGTELANRPANNATSGFRFELNSGASITYYVGTAGATPTGAPAYVKNVTVAGTTDEPLSGTDTLFITSISGVVIGRWIQR